MNIEVTTLGTSSNYHEACCQVFGPDLAPWLLSSFWRSYDNCASEGDYFPDYEFKRLVRAGHILCAWVLEPHPTDTSIDDWAVSAQFGVELMRDDQGPYTQFIFFDRDWADPERGPLMALLPEVVATCFEITRRYSEAENFTGTMRLRIAGRPGWRRIVKALGIEMHDGWITDKQGCFSHGHQWRWQ